MEPLKIRLDDKPNLLKALAEDREKAREVIGTFIELIEESFASGWVDIAEQLHPKLGFKDLVRGILRGSLDLKGINPEAYDALKIEVHPLSILQPRKNYLDGGMKYTNWRNYFKLPDDAGIGEETVAQIFRTMLRNMKYIDIGKLRTFLEANQVVTYRGLGDEQIMKLPFYPALKYQKAIGELHVGKFHDDTGFFDCGEIKLEDGVPEACPACKHQYLTILDLSDYALCEACNAGFKIV